MPNYNPAEINLKIDSIDRQLRALDTLEGLGIMDGTQEEINSFEGTETLKDIRDRLESFRAIQMSRLDALVRNSGKGA